VCGSAGAHTHHGRIGRRDAVNTSRKSRNAEIMPDKIDRLVVRPGTRNDVQEIVNVCTSSMEEGEDVGFGGPTSESLFGNVARLLGAWREPNLVGRKEVFVAEVNGRLVGCVSIEEKTDEIELVDIDVLRACQGRGVGSRMVQFVEEHARERAKRAVTLGTSRSAAGVPWKSFE
jgi:ribosomal protein S18 acetylase RimI-like enzyme